MEKLIQRQKIERRVPRIHEYSESIPQNIGIKNAAGAPSSVASIILPVRPHPTQGVVHNWFYARLQSIGAQLMNSHLCYLLACMLVVILSPSVLNAHSSIFVYALQAPLFQLPTIEDNYLPVYISRSAVEVRSDNSTLENYNAVQTRQYIVQSGQTLSELSEIHNVTMSTLVSFNSISNARALRAGSTYVVPDREGILYTVKGNDNIEDIAQSNNISVNTVLDVNNLQSASLESGQTLFLPGAELSDFDLRLSLGELFALPTYGRRSSGFGYRNDPFTNVRRFHYGIDIAAPTGTPISASMEGRVSYIGEQSRGYGKYVIIRHPGGFQSLYAHMNGFNVRSNQSVVRGQTIGWIGNTGRSTGPHLHFAIIKNGRFVNPNQYLY